MMKIIYKAKHTGRAWPIRYTTPEGWERIAIIRWVGTEAHIHSMWADSATHHHFRILARMTG